MKKNLFLLAAAAIVAGCSSDDSEQMAAPAGKPAASELQQLTFGSSATRAHWVDAENSLTFAWDEDLTGQELVCAIVSEGTSTPSYKVSGNEVGEAQYASYLTITPDTDDAGNATFTTVNSFHKDAALTGQAIHAVTPVSSDKVTATASAFSVEMPMPNSFTQTASGDLTHLRPYMQMYATATLMAGDNNLAFNHIPATLGFNIVNSGTSAVTVKSVTIDAVEATNGVIAAPLSSAMASYSVTSGLDYSAENPHTAVTTVLGGTEGVTIDASSSYLAYALVLPLGTDAALQNAYLRVRVTTTEGTYTLYTLSGEQLKTKTEAGTYDWQSGKFYGFKLVIPEFAETYSLPNGDTFEGLWSTVLGECTKVRFVAGSSKTSSSVLSTDGNSVSGYWVTNGDWLELHTSAKVFKAASNCQDMFQWRSTLTAIDFGCNFNTESMTSMYRMFRDCSGLTVLDLRGFNTKSVSSMHMAFDGCSNLATLMLGENFTTSKATKTYSMFSGCSSLTSLDVSRFDVAKVTDMQYMFNGCSSLTSLDVSGFVTTKATNMAEMFKDCSGISSLDLKGFNTSNVTAMNGMFRNCSSLTSLDVSEFVTDKVTNMAEMFSSCSKLTSIDLKGFNTANVTDMQKMFRDCGKLKSLDLSSFNTEKVTSMYEMFRNHNLQTVDLSSFSFAGTPSVTYLFRKNSAKLFVSREGYTYLLENVDSGNGVSSSNMYDKETNRLWSEIIAEEEADSGTE